VLTDNPRALVVRHDAASRSVQFNDKLIAFAKHGGFRPVACAPYRARTKGMTESGGGYVKKNAIAGHCFASWEAFEAHPAGWEREVANVRIHSTAGEAPIARFERDEAHRLKPLGGRLWFGSLRELTRVVGNDCAVEIDTNSYSVPWRLIGERVAATVAAGDVRIRHGVREVAVHKHHSHVLTIRGDSYRLRAKRKSGLIKPLAGDEPPVGSACLWASPTSSSTEARLM
jgi:hypothetical protein